MQESAPLLLLTGKVCREKLKIGEESLSGSASWSRFGYSSIHSKFLAHCLIDGKGRAPFGRARTFWKGMPLLEGHAQLCLIGEKGPAPFGRVRPFWKGAHILEGHAPFGRACPTLLV